MKNWLNNVLKPIATYGGILAGIVILHSVVMDVLGFTFSKYNQIAGFVLPIIGFVIAIYAYRKEYSNNQISYGKAVGVGVLVAFIFGILISGYSVINMNYINPDYKDLAMQMAEENLLESGYNEDFIEMAVARQEKNMEPVRMMIVGPLFMSFMSLIVSLIAASFIKKEAANPFSEVDIE
jgi:Protein of unknown function (DUF4199)